MLDFSATPFFDNHTHRINVENREIRPVQLGIAFMHGWGPINPLDRPLGTSAEVENCTPEYEKHVMNMGVVKVLVNRLAQRFGCDATPEAVVAHRNKLTKEDGLGYAKALYEEANVIGEMVDDGAPFGDSALNCFPAKIYRLFQMDPFFHKLLKECDSFSTLKSRFEQGIRERLAEGFAGIKCHVLENRYQPMRIVEDTEADALFSEAKNGNQHALEDVYQAIFQHVLILSQELDFPVHIHTGCTGNPHDLKTNTDVFTIAPLMRDHRFYASHIVFLHGNPPDYRRLAWICHAYPNVWMDLSWTLPWVCMDMDQILEEILAMAPHDKIMLGTGQHDHAEMVWLASWVAKQSLARVLQKQVDHGMLSEAQAKETGEQILYKNALTLYKQPIK